MVVICYRTSTNRSSAEFWTNLQSAYELDVARQEIGGKLEKEIEPVAA